MGFGFGPTGFGGTVGGGGSGSVNSFTVDEREEITILGSDLVSHGAPYPYRFVPLVDDVLLNGSPITYATYIEDSDELTWTVPNDTGDTTIEFGYIIPDGTPLADPVVSLEVTEVPLSAPQFLMDGDSLTQGVHVDSLLNYPAFFREILTGTQDPSNAEIKNIGVSGQPVYQMVIDSPAKELAFWVESAVRRVYVLWGGANDLYLGETPEDTYAAICQRITDAIANGATDCFVLTVTPNAIDSEETDRNTLNGLINGGVPGAIVIDLTAMPEFDAKGDEENDEIYIDGDETHLTSTGYILVADRVAQAMDEEGVFSCPGHTIRRDILRYTGFHLRLNTDATDATRFERDFSNIDSEAPVTFTTDDNYPFDGFAQFPPIGGLTIADTPNLRIGEGPFTFCGWYNAASISSLLRWAGSFTGVTNGGFAFYHQSGPYMKIYPDDATGPSHGTTDISVNTWTFVAGGLGADGKLFIRKGMAAKTRSASAHTGTNPSTAAAMQLGTLGSGDAGTGWEGKMGCITFVRTELSDDQLDELASGVELYPVNAL